MSTSTTGFFFRFLSVCTCTVDQVLNYIAVESTVDTMFGVFLVHTSAVREVPEFSVCRIFSETNFFTGLSTYFLMEVISRI